MTYCKHESFTFLLSRNDIKLYKESFENFEAYALDYVSKYTTRKWSLFVMIQRN